MNLGDESRFWPEGAFPDPVDPRWEAISAYVDGELDPTATRAVEAWLEHDAEARRVYDSFLALQNKLVTMPVPRQRTDLAAQVLQQVHREERMTILWRSVQAVVLGAVAWAGWQLRPMELALVSREAPPVEVIPGEIASESAEKSQATQQAATYLLANKVEPDALAILLQEL